jgi:hypothetical protein
MCSVMFIDRKSEGMYTFTVDSSDSAPECPTLNYLEGWASGAFFVPCGAAK